LIKASSDVVYRMNADWTELRQLQGREFIANMHEPTRSWMEKYILPDDQPRVLQTIREAIRSKGTFELEHQVMRIDGTLGWAFSRAIPLMDNDGAVVEWFGMASDVTARKQAQEALRASEARFRATFETAAIGIEHTGLDHRWLSVNPAMCSLTGYTAEELLAMTFTELTHPDDLADNLLQRHRLLDGEIASYKIENRLIHRSGRIVWVTASAALLRDAAGRPQYFVGALEDITQQKDTLVQLDMQRRFVERLAHGMPGTLTAPKIRTCGSTGTWANRWVTRPLTSSEWAPTSCARCCTPGTWRRCSGTLNSHSGRPTTMCRKSSTACATAPGTGAGCTRATPCFVARLTAWRWNWWAPPPTSRAASASRPTCCMRWLPPKTPTRRSRSSCHT